MAGKQQVYCLEQQKFKNIQNTILIKEKECKANEKDEETA